MTKKIRNICIIAHVDHGKTTLVDHMLRQAGLFQRDSQVSDRMMDSMDLERERGITIAAKNASFQYKDAKINLVDTPGHADFGGEVERIIGMVDGAFILVDAAEGPLPQTRFVLEKALKQGLKVALVINKVDRPEVQSGTRINEVVDQVFDLFIDLGASDEQADFSILYAAARQGWCTPNLDEVPAYLSGEKKGSLEPLFNIILDEFPAPRIKSGQDFQMMLANLGYSEYVGQLGIGRVMSGTVRRNQKIIRRGVNSKGDPTNENFTVTRIYCFQGMQQVEVEELSEGDIGLIAGCENFEIGDTLCGSESVEALPRIQVEKPTIGMIFSVNSSPLSGQEGEAIQSRKMRERLLKECRTNVALRFEETEFPDRFRVLGRGELQFGILIEQMRREGFEFMVGKPSVLFSSDDKGNRLEPMEHAVLDMPEQFAGEVTEVFQTRKGVMTKYETHHLASGHNRVRLEFDIPTRGLLGLQSQYLTSTKGEGLFSSHFAGYVPHKGDIQHRSRGALVSDRGGETNEYALLSLEERGILFFGPGVKVYEGMIIGEHSREDDLNVNPCKEKKLTNVRAASAEILVHLSGIRQMSLEKCIEWIDEDEWIEVTPQSIRIRKKVLAKNERSTKRAERVN